MWRRPLRAIPARGSLIYEVASGQAGYGKHRKDIRSRSGVGRSVLGERVQGCSEGAADGGLECGSFLEHARHFFRPQSLFPSQWRCGGTKHAQTVVADSRPSVRNLPQASSGISAQCSVTPALKGGGVGSRAGRGGARSSTSKGVEHASPATRLTPAWQCCDGSYIGQCSGRPLKPWCD
jgi:hypothetical protein